MMTKEQVLEHISKMDWQEDSWKKSEEQNRLEEAVAKYVVYQDDPDTHVPYGHEYHLTREAALEDYESRTTNDYLCHCVVSELYGDWRQERTLSRQLEPWD